MATKSSALVRGGSLLIVLLLTFVNSTVPQELGQSKKEQEASAKRDPNDWTLTRMGNGWTKSGYPFSVNTYKGSKGEIVLASMTHCGSPELAKKEYQSRIDAATKVIERGQVTDKSGKPGRDRAVLSVTEGDHKTSFRIVSPVGPNVWQIDSSSMQDALAFEKANSR